MKCQRVVTLRNTLAASSLKLPPSSESTSMRHLLTLFARYANTTRSVPEHNDQYPISSSLCRNNRPVVLHWQGPQAVQQEVMDPLNPRKQVLVVVLVASFSKPFLLFAGYHLASVCCISFRVFFSRTCLSLFTFFRDHCPTRNVNIL